MMIKLVNNLFELADTHGTAQIEYDGKEVIMCKAIYDGYLSYVLTVNGVGVGCVKDDTFASIGDTILDCVYHNG